MACGVEEEGASLEPRPTNVDAAMPVADAAADGRAADRDAETDVPVDASPDSLADPNLDPFDPSRVHELRLELDATALAVLSDPSREHEKQWTRGTLTFAGYTFAEVGVRRKGQSTFRAYPQKMALKIRFDRYVDGRTFRGLTDLTLNNMITDRSQLAERLGYYTFQALGLPVQRANSVHLTVVSPNGEEDFGVYANVETPNRSLLNRLYGARARSLYEAATGDWTGATGPEDEMFEVDEGEELEYVDLHGLFDAVVAAGEQTLLADMRARLDSEQWLRFCAAEAAIGQVDGYAFGHIASHNYFLVGDLDGRFSLLPWSLDPSFKNDIQSPPRADLPGKANFSGDARTLFSRCKDSAACWSAYRNEIARSMDALDTLDLPALAQSWGERIEPHVVASSFDSRKRLGARGAHGTGPGPNSYVSAWQSAQVALRSWLATRAAVVREQLALP